MHPFLSCLVLVSHSLLHQVIKQGLPVLGANKEKWENWTIALFGFVLSVCRRDAHYWLTKFMILLTLFKKIIAASICKCLQERSIHRDCWYFPSTFTGAVFYYSQRALKNVLHVVYSPLALVSSSNKSDTSCDMLLIRSLITCSNCKSMSAGWCWLSCSPH